MKPTLDLIFIIAKTLDVEVIEVYSRAEQTRLMIKVNGLPSKHFHILHSWEQHRIREEMEHYKLLTTR